jgi:hypothetical protein
MQLGSQADHSTPSITEIKNGVNYTSTPPYNFMAWWLIKPRNKIYVEVVSVYLQPSISANTVKLSFCNSKWETSPEVIRKFQFSATPLTNTAYFTRRHMCTLSFAPQTVLLFLLQFYKEYFR